MATTGCVEAEEAWVFDSTGGGTYALTVRWNADLWSRIGGIVGPEALRRIEGRPVPLRADAWRDGLRGLEGVTVEEVAEKDAPRGMREVSARLRFRRVQDLLRWEVLARRTMRIARADEGLVALRMEPLAQVAVLDRLASAQAVRERAGADVPLPAQVAEELAVKADDARLVATVLQPHLARVRFRFTVQPPGPVRSVGDAPVEADVTKATVDLSFDDLVKGRDRTVRCAWRPLALDVPPSADQVGDAPSAGATR